MTESKSAPRNRNAVLDALNERFAVIRQCQPLALGIHKVILERLPDLDPMQLRSAMRIHTASTRYLKELLTTKLRFDLDGQPAGEVSDEQQAVASAALKERFKKLADRRKIEEKAKKEAEQERENLQKRQEKLAQLAAHFKKH